jgi:dihydroorotase/N-acyl-D-amino-acid deacylase
VIHQRLIVLAITLGLGCGPATEYDLFVRGGTIYDGSGTPGVKGDVAVNGDRIAAVGSLRRSRGRREIDARNLAVAPGFIDMHAHLEPLLQLPDGENAVRQGVTTALGGPDGGSPWPLRPFLDSAERAGLGLNVAFLVGHNTIRRAVMGLAARAPTAGELQRMREMVAQAMGDGAFGVSTGLFYLPGTFARIDEIVSLSRVAADSGGIYTSHLRKEGLGLLDGVGEALEIGRRAGIPVVLTHHKVVGKPMWGASTRTLAMVDSARAAGVDVMMDQYPYAATYTGISALIPPWALADGDEAFRRRLKVAALRDSIVRGIVFNILNDRGGGDLSRVQLAQVPWARELEGRTLRDWADSRGLAPTPENGALLTIEAMEKGGASAIYHVLDDGDIDRIMVHPQTMIGSDGRLVRPGDGHPHPRWYGTFPRILGRYVRERKLLPLETAIHKMTGLSAGRLGLADRGRVVPGAFADLVVFDPAAVNDRASFEEPHQYPQGIPYVVVNGIVTVDAGAFTGARAGRVLRRPGRSEAETASR